MAAEKLPGAALAITMLETFVPRGVLGITLTISDNLPGLKSWFGVVRDGVMGREEECLHSFRFTSVTQLCVNKLLQVLNGCRGRGGNVLNNTLYNGAFKIAD